ncbi:MAG: sigma-54 dependent transcriptional regulator [Longimicrobiales bacterium]
MREDARSGLDANAGVLVVDDDAEQLEKCRQALLQVTDLVTAEAKSRRAGERLRSESFDLLVTDLRMPVLDGIDLLRLALSEDPELPVIILTGFPSVDTAVESLKLGASDYLTKPVNTDELIITARRLLQEQRLRSENRSLRRYVERPYAFPEMVWESEVMRAVEGTVSRLAQSDVDVLIVGETGTGKELVARSLHRLSEDLTGRFVPVDCGAIPEHLVESELFGHEKGAFTGADSRSVGLIEFADNGTFFLDEVSSLPLPLQAKLLRALQDRTVRRLGSTRESSVTLRVVAASNSALEELVSAGHFREDLYYRLNVGRVVLPPLRERREDIPLLLKHFLEQFDRPRDRGPLRFSDGAMEVLLIHNWPGNVRELQNLVRRSAAMAPTDVVDVEDLPAELGGASPLPVGGGRNGSFASLKEAYVGGFERDYLRRVMRTHDGDVTSAAATAELPRGTVYRLLKKHGLRARDFRQPS